MGLRHYESFFMEFRMYWIVNHSLDPAFNLALEEYFLGRIEPGHPGYAILWQNSPAIVVGRFQNTRQEVNADFVRERGISVVRRMTGGGAVYHDAGTLNYTFIHHLEKEGTLPAFSEAGKPIAEALQKLGLPVAFSGRNDLMLDGLKVAGVAHCRRGMRYLHHGCILVDSDLDVLSQALNVDPAKYKSKGVASVRSRVGNLAGYLAEHSPDLPPLTVQRVRDAIMEHRSGDEYRMSASPSPVCGTPNIRRGIGRTAHRLRSRSARRSVSLGGRWKFPTTSGRAAWPSAIFTAISSWPGRARA